MRLNNPSHRSRGHVEVKNKKEIGFHPERKCEKSSNGPPFGSISREK